MNRKKQQLLETALALFYQYGMKSIGINEVLKRSGIAKKTLYTYFESKESLILATLKQRHETYLVWLEKKLRDHDSDVETAKSLFQALTEWFYNQSEELGTFNGCYFINTAAEARHEDSAISHYCLAHKEKVRQTIQRYLPDTEESLIDAICLLQEGAIVTAYINHDPSAAQKCLPVIERLFHKRSSEEAPTGPAE
jgi:AcrR family transcriptional regulator